MKYSSKMAENCELKNKLNKHATEQSKTLSDLKKTAIKALIIIIHFTSIHKLPACIHLTIIARKHP